MKLLNQKTEYLIIFGIVIASFFAKNTVSYPLGSDFSCSYGVPLAVFEQCSQHGVISTKFISNEYNTSAISFAPNNVWLNLFINLSVNVFLCYFVFLKYPESRFSSCITTISYCLVTYLLCSLISSILIDWNNNLYRILYINIIFSYILIFLLAIINVCSILSSKIKGNLSSKDM